MTVHVGVFPFLGLISCYDENKKVTNHFEIIKVKPNESKKISSMFNEISLKINGTPGNICICILPVYDNKIRKKFIELGVKHGFQNVQIINKITATYLNAMAQIEYKPLNGVVIWLRWLNTIYVWHLIEQKAQFIGDWGILGEDIRDLNLLKRIIKESNKVPNVILHSNDIDVSAIKKISPTCKFFTFKPDNDGDYGSLIKARITARDPVFAHLETISLLFSNISLYLSNSNIKTFKNLQELPITYSTNLVKSQKNDVFKVVDIKSGRVDNVQLPNGKEIFLTFKIDTNEIYYVNFDEAYLENVGKNYVDATKIAKNPTVNLLDISNTKNYKIPMITAPFNANISVVGIDLGTSRCCAAVNRKNGLHTVPLDHTGERLLPSYVAFDEKTPKCGKIVVQRLRHFSKSTVFDSKRILGRVFDEIEIDQFWPFELLEAHAKINLGIQSFDGKEFVTAEEVSGTLLKHIKQKAEEFQGKKLTEAVITVPAAFTEAQNKATLEAAKRGGWDRVSLLPEPIAAAFAYFMDRSIPDKTNVLLFDLGGGTLDVCIFKIEKDDIQIISNTGDTKLGGRDFDTVLINYFKNALITKYSISVASAKKYLLMTKCQTIKENLSTLDSDVLDIDEFDPAQEGIIAINRETFQKMANLLLNKIKNTIQSALFQSKFERNQINKVLQVGGGSRMPMIKELLQKMFPQAEQCCEEHPDEVVAIGAAFYSAIQMTQQNLKKNEELTTVASANKVKVISADITTLKVDAIVNSASHNLLGGSGGGVNGAIHAAAGIELFIECETLNDCIIGEAKITKAYNIKNVKAIIHTIGPYVYTDNTKKELYNCYKNSLIVAVENGMRTIAFPSISTGKKSFPKNEAAKIATKAVKDFLNDKKNSEKIDEIIFCVYEKEDEDIYKELLPKVFSILSFI